jgi:hypothetical protein
MKRYRLLVNMDDDWEWYCTIMAATRSDAFRRAMLNLSPEHFDKAIHLDEIKQSGNWQESGDSHNYSYAS